MQERSSPGPVRCWEWLSCSRGTCGAFESEDLRCWLTAGNLCFEGDLPLTQRLSARCAACPVFVANRERSAGKRSSDRAVLDTVDALLCESVENSWRAELREAELRSKSAQFALLSEVGRALHSTMEIDRILWVILTAVTAGDGLGLNRAFLLLVDHATSTVRGRMGVGPRHPGEAELIWRAMERERKGLGAILTSLLARETTGEGGLKAMAETLVFPLNPSDNIVARSLDQGTSFIVTDPRETPDARGVAEILANDHFMVVPLLAEGRKLGVIVADNFVTARQIRPEDVRLLETFASQAALAIMNASLHRDLERKLDELETAHEELTVNQVQLLRAERLLALGGLASSLVHDFRAPIVTIGVLANEAIAGLPDNAGARASLEEIKRRVGEIEKYLRDLAGHTARGRRDVKPVDVAALVKDSLSIVGGLVAVSEIATVTRLNHGSSMICGDHLELKQMVLNLLCNAVEAMPHGGTLTVETAVREDMLELRVEDTGTGIPDNVRSKMFSAFFTTKAEGSGLGLFMARRVATDHGGTIEFKAGDGRGTCFSVFLPVFKRAGESERDATR